MSKSDGLRQKTRHPFLGHSEFADLSLLLVAIVWGSSYSVAKTALSYLPVVVFLLIRFSLTSFIMLPFSWRSIAINPMRVLVTGVPLGVILFLIFVCETTGIARTSASNAAFLISLCVVFTPIVEGITFQQFPGWKILVATGLSCVGAGLLALQGGYHFNVGDWLMLAAAVLRACMVTATKKLTHGRQQLNSTALTAIQITTVAVLTGLVLWGGNGNALTIPTQPMFWFATLYLCVCCTLFPFYIQTHMVRLTTPTRVSLLMGAEPVFGAIFAVLLLGEEISLQSLVGGSLIVIATYLGIRQEDAKGIRLRMKSSQPDK
jgi:drug/metabolite transporter (DMT)-like permease